MNLIRITKNKHNLDAYFCLKKVAKNYATPKTVSPKMQIKKSYLCDIFRLAWQIKKSENIAFSEALKKAWAWAKKPKNKKKFKPNQTVLL